MLKKIAKPKKKKYIVAKPLPNEIDPCYEIWCCTCKKKMLRECNCRPDWDGVKKKHYQGYCTGCTKKMKAKI